MLKLEIVNNNNNNNNNIEASNDDPIKEKWMNLISRVEKKSISNTERENVYILQLSDFDNSKEEEEMEERRILEINRKIIGSQAED